MIKQTSKKAVSRTYVGLHLVELAKRRNSFRLVGILHETIGIGTCCRPIFQDICYFVAFDEKRGRELDANASR